MDDEALTWHAERRLLHAVMAWAMRRPGELGLELDELLAEDERSHPVVLPLEVVRRLRRHEASLRRG